MSQPKSSVSALQEFCAQNNADNPNYIVISDAELGFVCKVEVMEIEEHGNGRSKRDAKHMAATNALKHLSMIDPAVNVKATEIEEYEDFVDLGPLPPVDSVALLRDFCVQNDHPLPKFELVSQYGTPNAPRFTMLCQIASIKRYRTSDSKKAAKQKVAFQMYLVIRDSSISFESGMELVAMNAKIDTVEEERVRIFKSYRQLIDSGERVEDYGTPLFERHNALKKFHDHLKQAVFVVLNTDYDSPKSQVDDVLFALKLKAKTEKIPSLSGREMIFMELDCPNFDICFCGYEEKIYHRILKFFRNMLK